MIHDVPRGGSDATVMTLTEAPIELDDQLEAYFRSKISSSLSNAGVDVIVDPAKDSTVSDAVVAVLDEPDVLPEQSRLIATRLHKVQTGVNPPGLLTVIYGISDRNQAVSILKLEREEGIRFEVKEKDGQLTVDLQFLRDLTLTNKTRVFKTSLFRLTDSQTSLIGSVSDEQRGAIEGRGVAEFFLGTFLGTRLRLSPARATQQFVKAAEDFLNADISSPEIKARYQVALLATMQNSQEQITPAEFAQTYLDEAHRQRFLDVAQHNELAPDKPFTKDTSLVKVPGFRMLFENGMVLVGSAEDLDRRVVVKDQAVAPGVQILDRIKAIRNK